MYRFNICIVMVVIAAGLCSAAVAAGDIDVERLADAIYWAEGGPDTNHPYGILKKYKVTTPRQACINTINHALKDWDGYGDFISFLGSRYCPVNCDNDNGTNQYWIKNVRELYAKRSGNKI